MKRVIAIIHLLVFFACNGNNVGLKPSNGAARQRDTFAAEIDSPISVREDTRCATELDTLSKMVVYTEVQVTAENEGGMGALMRRLNERISLKNLPIDSGYDANHLVAFIVDTDGSIKGGRVLKNGSDGIGNQILTVVASFKWTPAICNGNPVPMLYKFPLLIDITTQ